MENKQKSSNEAHSEPLQQCSVSGSYDSQKCEKCGGRTALITGTFYYDAYAEPYNNGVEEEAKVEIGDCWVGGYKCDNCGNVQGLWHE